MTALRGAPPSTIHASYSPSVPVLPLWTQQQGSPLCDCSPIVNLQRALRVDTYGPQVPVQDQPVVVSDADSGTTVTAAHHCCLPSTRLRASPANGPCLSLKPLTIPIFPPLPSSKSFHWGPSSKSILGRPPHHSVRSWHGTNLYCAQSVAKHGLRGSTPDHGPFGVYSFNDSRVWKMQFYCVYTISGTGRAWTAIVELAIPDGKYQTVSKVQWCSQAEDTTIVAVWLHGLEYSEFRSEFIWPTWNPELEIQPRP